MEHLIPHRARGLVQNYFVPNLAPLEYHLRHGARNLPLALQENY